MEDCGYDLDEHHPTAWEDDKPYDSNGREYNPYAGSKTPTEGRCNGILTEYEERYGEKRYCMAWPSTYFSNAPEMVPFCRHHRAQAELMKQAKEMFKHGLFSQSIIHVYDKMEPMKKLVALGTYDSLVGESSIDFDTERQDHYIDFDEYEDEIPLEIASELTEDERLPVTIPVPDSKVHRCLALYHAAIDEVKKINVNEAIITEGMTQEVPTEHGSFDEEHPLNLPYSRLVKNHKEHLEYGGISLTDNNDGVTMNNVEMSELIVDVDPDPHAISNDGASDNPMHNITSEDIDIDE